MGDRRALLALAALCVLLGLPESLHQAWAPWRALTLSGETLLLLLAARALPARVGPWLVGVGWTGLLVFELVRLGSVYLTAREPLLYDVAWLARHVGVLVMDLWGAVGIAGAVGVLVALLGVVAGVRALARPLHAGGPSTRWLAALAGVSALGLVSGGPWPGRWSLPPFVESLSDSWEVWQAVQRGVSGETYAHHAGVTLERRPDVELYVVESYGHALDAEPWLSEPWRAALTEHDAALEAGGWHRVSGFATAPVSGGRSWLSDGSVMLGLDVAHESVWQHLRQHTEALPHLPGFLARQGYETVVVRPKDRERPGIQHRNDFGWGHTVFYERLAWPGPEWGWGIIPDQYSLGRLHDELLPEIGGPRLVFFHGVASHGPWKPLPPRLDDWRALADAPGPDTPEGDPAKRPSHLKRYLSLYERHDRLWFRRFGALETWGPDYLGAVLYSLDVTLNAVGPAPTSEDGRVVVVYGDHQPPLISQGRGMLVPVHVLASDPTLLDAFREVGFTDGMQPTAETGLHLSGLYPVLVRALAAGDGQDVAADPVGPDVTTGVRPKKAR